MDIILQKSVLNGKIIAISSKSYCHRALIMASRAESDTVIKGLIKSQDVLATCRAIENLGAEVKWTSDSDCIVSPIEIIPQQDTMDIGESGSTLRFIIPQIAQLNANRNIVCHGRLPSRTNEELFRVLSAQGCQIKQNGDTITVKGKIGAGVYSIRGDVSSQYISGLLMALSTCKDDSKIVITSATESQSYIDITVEIMAKFGVKVEKTDNGYFVGGGQKIKANNDITIEGDWSNATPWVVAAALQNNVGISGLKLGGGQGDENILVALRQMGARIIDIDGNISVKADKLTATAFSVADCPDLAPMLAVAMAKATGISKITDCERLRLKESDRIEAIISTLHSVGINSYYDDGIVIEGGEVVGGVCQSFADHRIVMMATILSTVAKGEITIMGAESINKSYPNFFNEFVMLGGIVHER